MLTFLKNCKKKPVYATNLESSRFLLRLAYLADIFSALNDLCISLQRQGTDVISSMEKITAFKWKLTLWLKRVPKGSFDHFPKFNELRESMEVDKNVLSDIKNQNLILFFQLKKLPRHRLKIHSWSMLMRRRRNSKKKFSI